MRWALDMQASHHTIATHRLVVLTEVNTVSQDWGYFLFKPCNSISIRTTYTIAKNGCLVILLSIYYSLMQHLVQSCTIEDIVAKYEASGIITNEFLSDNEGLG